MGGGKNDKNERNQQYSVIVRGANSILFMLKVSPLMSPQSIHFVLHCHSNRHPKCHPNPIFYPKITLILLLKTRKTASDRSNTCRKPFKCRSISVLAVQTHPYFVALERISSPALIHAFLFSTTPPLLNPTRSNEHCFIPISSAVRTL